MFTSRPGSCLSSGYHRHNPRTGRSTGKKENRETEEEEEEEEIRDDRLSLSLWLLRPSGNKNGEKNEKGNGTKFASSRKENERVWRPYHNARYHIQHGAERKDSIGSYVGDQGSTRYRAGSVFRMPRARLIARWPRFIGRGWEHDWNGIPALVLCSGNCPVPITNCSYSRPTVPVDRFGGARPRWKCQETKHVTTDTVKVFRYGSTTGWPDESCRILHQDLDESMRCFKWNWNPATVYHTSCSAFLFLGAIFRNRRLSVS